MPDFCKDLRKLVPQAPTEGAREVLEMLLSHVCGGVSAQSGGGGTTNPPEPPKKP